MPHVSASRQKPRATLVCSELRASARSQANRTDLASPSSRKGYRQEAYFLRCCQHTGGNHMQGQRNEVVDAYRAILVGCVMAFHYFVYSAPPFTDQDLYHFSRRYPESLAVGRLGVMVFFIISGLVITMTVSRSHSSWDFVFRRFSRLFPTFFVCCTLTFIILRVFRTEGYIPTYFDYLASFTLHAEKFHAQIVDGSYWSLGVEIRFYAYVAFFFSFLKEKFWIGICILGVLAIVQQITGLSFTNYYLIGAFVALFLLGMSLWYMSSGDRLPAYCTFGVGSVLFSLQSIVPDLRAGEVSNQTLYVVILFVGLTLAVVFRVGESWRLWPLSYLGRLSYALYLLHQNIGVTIIGAVKVRWGLPDMAAVAIASAVCIGLSALVFHLVEEPAQHLLRRLAPGLRRSTILKPHNDLTPQEQPTSGPA